MKMELAALLDIAASGKAGRSVAQIGLPGWWQDALSLVMNSSSIVIVTGFMVAPANAPETDGPPGSSVLGRAMMMSGKKVTIYTDPFCFDAVSRCSNAIGGPPVFRSSGAEGILEDGADLLIFVERPGKTHAGRYRSMRGEDISPITIPLDDAAAVAKGQGVRVIAIGDGGNEAGMGKIAGLIQEILPGYMDSVSCVESDVLLPADVSNWGAYALSAILSVASGKWLGHSPEEEEKMLGAMVDAGAVDGVTGKPSMSVDSFDLSVQKEVVERMRSWFEDQAD